MMPKVLWETTLNPKTRRLLRVQIADGQPGRAIRTGRWKYAVHVPDEHGTNQPSYDTYHETHLYDLLYDPHELTNLVAAESHAIVRDACRQRLLNRMADAGEPTPTIVQPAELWPKFQREVTPEEAAA